MMEANKENLQMVSKQPIAQCNQRRFDMAINLILFGFIVYTALIVVPSIWEELTAQG